ncbi:MAG: LysE family translocator [Bacteroidia bacterium]
MFVAIRDGFFVGFALAFLIGPVFFLLLSTSINKGLRQAIFIATGVMLSDAIYIVIAYFGSSLLTGNKEFNYLFGIIGGAILIVFGIVNFFKKPAVNKNEADEYTIQKTDFLKFFFKGFALNSFNPFVLVFWLGVASGIAVKNFTPPETFGFYTMVLATVLSTDILKSYLANKLQRIITVTVLIWMNRISGLALVFYGIKIMVKSFM